MASVSVRRARQAVRAIVANAGRFDGLHRRANHLVIFVVNAGGEAMRGNRLKQECRVCGGMRGKRFGSVQKVENLKLRRRPPPSGDVLGHRPGRPCHRARSPRAPALRPRPSSAAGDPRCRPGGRVIWHVDNGRDAAGRGRARRPDEILLARCDRECTCESIAPGRTNASPKSCRSLAWGAGPCPTRSTRPSRMAT